MNKEHVKRACVTKHAVLFGDFIAAAYDACGKHRAGEIVQFAVNARLVEFLGRWRFEILSTGSGGRGPVPGRF
jgi:hypothetical protein